MKKKRIMVCLLTILFFACLTPYPSEAATNTWVYENGNWYYYNANGELQKGWATIGGVRYYFNSSGVMMTDWVFINGYWYYFDSSGAMKTGWLQDDGKWYYLDSSGAMVTGWKLIDGKWYYFNSSGVMQTGWIQDNGKWYYLDSSGIMLTGWIKYGGYYYYLDSSGVMVTGTKTINGETYEFTSSGELILQGVSETTAKGIERDWIYYPVDSMNDGKWQVVNAVLSTDRVFKRFPDGALGTTANVLFTGWYDPNGYRDDRVSIYEFTFYQNGKNRSERWGLEQDNDVIGITFRHTQRVPKSNKLADQQFYYVVINGGEPPITKLELHKKPYGVDGDGDWWNTNKDLFWTEEEVAQDRLAQSERDILWKPKTPMKVKVVATNLENAVRIQVYVDGRLELDYTDTDDPYFEGTWGPYTFSQAETYFYDLSYNGIPAINLPPKISATLTPSIWTNQYVTIRVNATDEDGEISHIVLPNGTILYTSTATYTVSSNGDYTFKAYDNKQAYTMEKVSVKNIDPLLPNIDIRPNGHPDYKKFHSVTVSVRDEGSGIKTSHYGWSTSKTDEPSSWTPFSNDLVLQTPENSGTHYLWVKAVDHAGNKKTVISNPFYVDAVPPNFVALQTPENDQWTNNKVTLILKNISDVGSGYKNTKLPDGSYVTSTTINYDVKENGIYTFVVSDYAGNVKKHTFSVSNIDKKKPIVEIEEIGRTSSKLDIRLNYGD